MYMRPRQKLVIAITVYSFDESVSCVDPLSNANCTSVTSKVGENAKELIECLEKRLKRD